MSRNLFAVIPAAGHSRRMGHPKLLLPLGGETVLSRLLAALDRPEIAKRVVVVRSDDDRLRREAERCGATVVQPVPDPPDMRTSVERALESLRDRNAPASDDGWLLIPADHPVLDADLVQNLIDVWLREQPRILVPTFQGRRGHPTIFRWDLAEEVSGIPHDRGLNWLLQKYADDVREVAVESAAILFDLDTPADYESLLRNWGDADSGSR